MLYYEGDLTRQNVREILTLQFKPKTRSWVDYEYAKKMFVDDWTDEIARWVSEYMGV